MISTSFDSDFSWFNDMINNKNQTSFKVFLPKIAFKVHIPHNYVPIPDFLFTVPSKIVTNGQ